MRKEKGQHFPPAMNLSVFCKVGKSFLLLILTACWRHCQFAQLFTVRTKYSQSDIWKFTSWGSLRFCSKWKKETFSKRLSRAKWFKFFFFAEMKISSLQVLHTPSHPPVSISKGTIMRYGSNLTTQCTLPCDQECFLEGLTWQPHLHFINSLHFYITGTFLLRLKMPPEKIGCFLA